MDGQTFAFFKTQNNKYTGHKNKIHMNKLSIDFQDDVSKYVQNEDTFPSLKHKRGGGPNACRGDSMKQS